MNGFTNKNIHRTYKKREKNENAKNKKKRKSSVISLNKQVRKTFFIINNQFKIMKSSNFRKKTVAHLRIEPRA